MAGKTADARSDDAVDWGAFAAVAAAHLGWPPDVFWRATPREFMAAMQRRLGRSAPSAGARPFNRADLAHLLARFPDET